MFTISSTGRRIAFTVAITFVSLVLSYVLGRLFLPTDVFFEYALVPTVAIPLLVSVPVSWMVSGQMKMIHLLNQTLRRQLRQDYLTGAGTRRWFFERAEALDRRGPNGILLLDLDFFKDINDTKGHDAGDTVLREVADRLMRSARSREDVFRFGGEEFVILLPGADREAVLGTAEHIRRTLAQDPVWLGEEPVFVTASMGATVLGVGDDLAEAVRSADIALYRAKEDGRDRVHFVATSAAIPVRELRPRSVRLRPLAAADGARR